MPEGQLLWEPSPEALERSEMARFMRDRGFESYNELWRWSVRDLEGFWGSLWDEFEIMASSQYERVLGKREMPGAEWFPGAELNYAEHVFRMASDRPAMVHASELRETSEVSWAELRDQAAGIAAGLRRLGVQRGDRVVAYMPNIPETAAALLACASIGAIWSSAAPEFGAPTVIDRFSQIEPKVLLAVDGYRYNGRDFDRREIVDGIAAEVGGRVVRLGYLDGTGWEPGFEQAGELRFERVPFDHPLWVLYSSGTTGLPKAIVQGQGGILLEHLKKLHLHVDAQAGDRIFWFTTTGWMMWNFLVSGLLTEAAIVLYDGSPGHPDMGVLWDLAESAGITCFGTSAAYIAACMKAGVEPRTGRDLSTLRSVGSTGSPLSPEGFRWIYDHVGDDTWLFSTSGGTDLCTAFVGGCPVLPVYEGELQARSLGASVEAWDPEGRPLIGEVGELVITRPMPSMPLYFWNDPDGDRYRESYFGMYPGVWRHGDWIKILPDGGCVIYGRSDSTLNRGGVRMGTADFYRVVESFDEIADSLVIDTGRLGQEGRLLLYVQPAPGARVDDDLVSRLRSALRSALSPRHVPDEIHEVPGIPRTLSGKKLEVPVRKILLGTPIEKAANPDSMANPDVLKHFTPQE